MDGTNFLTDLWQMAKTAGPFATCLMLVIWFKCDRERLKLQSERDALLERVLKNNDKVGDTMQAALALIGQQKT